MALWKFSPCRSCPLRRRLPLRAPANRMRCAARRAMLARIGWDGGQRLQDAVYGRMSLSRKMEIALRWRETQLIILRRHLAAGNPHISPEGLRQLTLERL